MHIHNGRESTRGPIGSVERNTDNLGIVAGSTALGWHSADSRRHSEPRCRCAGWPLFAVRRLVIGRLRRLIKYRQPVVDKLG